MRQYSFTCFADREVSFSGALNDSLKFVPLFILLRGLGGLSVVARANARGKAKFAGRRPTDPGRGGYDERAAVTVLLPRPREGAYALCYPAEKK